LILRFLISFRLFGYILTPFLGGSLESCLPYPSRGGKTFVLKQSFFQYIQNLPNPNGLASFASCVVWDLPAIATDRCRSNYSQDRKEKSIIRSFSLRRNPLQPNLLAFSSKARKICPFCLFCYKIGYPPVKFWEAYLSQTFPPKSPQSKDSRRWARTAHGETIRAERAQRGHPSIHSSLPNHLLYAFLFTVRNESCLTVQSWNQQRLPVHETETFNLTRTKGSKQRPSYHIIR
jgi:hypothetical protein